MPDLSPVLITDLTERLERYLASKGGFGDPVFVNAGGSAAVFKVQGPDGLRAFKVFDPRFINDDEGSKEKQRLMLQERLINHDCESLVQTYVIETAEDTAFIEMEFVEWPQLKNSLADVPDDRVTSLISQLVQAVQYLESLHIVHRDIKPENIHVSSDWTRLKLLDLGVVREFDPGPDGAETDQGNLRPFLATAQYSSPEYLFRLDEPSADLWRALNFYQVGAVLHDLIMKEALFQSEINTDNRWLVAKAVLTQNPSFIDGVPERLASHKSLARRCLEKDMGNRLRLVDWGDFGTLDSSGTLDSLRNRLGSKRVRGEAGVARELNFERGEFQEALISKVRDRLVAVCKTDLPMKLHSVESGDLLGSMFVFKPDDFACVSVRLLFSWRSGVYQKTVDVYQSASIFHGEDKIDFSGLSPVLIGSISMESPLDGGALDLSTDIARVLEVALDVLEASGFDAGQLENICGNDLMSISSASGAL